MSRAHFRTYPYDPCERTHAVPASAWPAAVATPAPAPNTVLNTVLNASSPPLPAPPPHVERRPSRRAALAPSGKASELPLRHFIEAMTEVVRAYTEPPTPAQRMKASAYLGGQSATQVGAPPMLPETIHLTPRQLEILRLWDDGLRPKQIAERLCLSVATVRAHIRDAIQRLEVSGTAAALRRARLLGLLGLLLLLQPMPTMPTMPPMW